jgi:hypothetical protein
MLVLIVCQNSIILILPFPFTKNIFNQLLDADENTQQPTGCEKHLTLSSALQRTSENRWSP